MFKELFLILLLAISSLQLISQETCTGILIDAKTSEPLAYVNIGILGKNIGTVSNTSGAFEIELDSKHDDATLRMSMLGYESQEFLVSTFRKMRCENATIELKPVVTELKEVEISGKKLKDKKLGNTLRSNFMTTGFNVDNLGNEVGVYIKVKKNRQSVIKEFKTHLAYNAYDKVRFRLNVYSTKDGLPHKNLLPENVIIECEEEESELFVDLRPYNIVTEGDFIVTLEWLEDLGERGIYFRACVLCDDAVRKSTSQGTWERESAYGVGFNVLVSQ